MCSKEEMYDILCQVVTPYDTIDNQLEADKALATIWKDNKDLENYFLSQMIPKVTYDDWCVCLYMEDKKLYYINEEGVSAVEPVDMLAYNEDFEVLKEDGEPMTEEEIYDHCPDYLCAGETDDMKYFFFFE